MSIFSYCRRSGSILVHLYEVFKWIYRNKVYSTNDYRDGIQFHFSIAGYKDSASGNSLCSLDGNRSPGSSHSRNRAV